MAFQRVPWNSLQLVTSRGEVPRVEACKVLHCFVDLLWCGVGRDGQSNIYELRTLSRPKVVPNTLRVAVAVGWRMTWDATPAIVDWTTKKLPAPRRSVKWVRKSHAITGTLICHNYCYFFLPPRLYTSLVSCSAAHNHVISSATSYIEPLHMYSRRFLLQSRRRFSAMVGINILAHN